MDEFRPMPAGFMPEFTTRVDENGYEIRVLSHDSPRLKLAYELSSPDDREAGRRRQPDRDAMARFLLWQALERRRIAAGEEDGA